MAGEDVLSNVTFEIQLDDSEWERLPSSLSVLLFQDLSDGLHVWRLRSVDKAGNLQTDEHDTRAVVVDTSVPVVQLAVQSPTNVAPAVCVSVLDATSCTISVSGEMASGEVLPELVVRTNGNSGTDSSGSDGMVDLWGMLGGVEALATNGTFCVTVAPPEDGLITLSVFVHDAAGNTATVSPSEVVFDTEAPSTFSALPSHWNPHCRAWDPAATSCDGLGVPLSPQDLSVDDLGPMLVAAPVCSLGTVHVFASCQPSEGTTAPCFVEYRVAYEVVRQNATTPGCEPEGSGPASASDASSSSSSDEGGGSVTPGGAFWVRVPEGSVLSLPGPLEDALATVEFRSRDTAGNVGSVTTVSWWWDVTPIEHGPVVSNQPEPFTVITTAGFSLALDPRTAAAPSPGNTTLCYSVEAAGIGRRVFLSSGAGVRPGDTVVLPSLPVELDKDRSYTALFWVRDQAGHLSAVPTAVVWTIVSVAPSVEVLRRPAVVSSRRSPVFVFRVRPSDGGGPVSASNLVWFEVSLPGDPIRGAYHRPCSEPDARADCATVCNSTVCEYTLPLSAPGQYNLLVRAAMAGAQGRPELLAWEYLRCSAAQYAVITGEDSIRCEECPQGGDCSGGALGLAPEAVVTQSDIVSRVGWWASGSSSGLRYYECVLREACLPGRNGTRSQCAEGYGGATCSVCSDGFFLQFGRCVRCPKVANASVFIQVASSLSIVVGVFLFFHYRRRLPTDVLKVRRAVCAPAPPPASSDTLTCRAPVCPAVPSILALPPPPALLFVMYVRCVKRAVVVNTLLHLLLGRWA